MLKSNLKCSDQYRQVGPISLESGDSPVDVCALALAAARAWLCVIKTRTPWELTGKTAYIPRAQRRVRPGKAAPGTAEDAHAIASPGSVPLLVPKWSVSMPRRWSMLT